MAPMYWRFSFGLIVLSCLINLAVLLPAQEEDESAVIDELHSLADRPQAALSDEDQSWAQLLAENYRDLEGNSAQADLEDSVRRKFEGEEEEVASGRLEEVEHWPVKGIEVGDISGVATDPEGYVYLFHRANRHWTEETFDASHIFNGKDQGAIKESTIAKLNATNGIVLDKTGADLFYLPHGLTIDSKGNKWMTDVALHQVFKFEAEKKEPSLVLGKKFEPAANHSDTERFCKPTDVAVASNGDFFVSDGYCASRIMKFNKNGKFITQFGVNDFEVAHSLALAEDLDLICGADREGMRVLCYNAGLKDPSKTGEAEREYTEENLGRVYSIAYSQHDGMMYGVTGLTGMLIPQGFTIDMRDDVHYRTDFIAGWAPEDEGFEAPHALAVSGDGESIYVADMSDKRPVIKFVKEVLPF